MLVSVGSIYAADDGHAGLDMTSEDDDFDLDDDLDEDLDDDGSDDDFEDDDLDDEDDEFDDDLDDEDDGSDDDLDDEDDDFEDDDIDDLEDDYNYSDFDYLKLKVTLYLDKYGNCSDYNWTESEEFLNEYQIYLLNTSEYKLNESAEGYNTYLKIFDSITSTFEDYNLTENETDYLKFMVIFYLNKYGNVSANYTWNESESFANFSIFDYDVLRAMVAGAVAKASYSEPVKYLALFKDYNPIYMPLTNSTDVNQTSIENKVEGYAENILDGNIFIFFLMIILVILVII